MPAARSKRLLLRLAPDPARALTRGLAIGCAALAMAGLHLERAGPAARVLLVDDGPGFAARRPAALARARAIDPEGAPPPIVLSMHGNDLAAALARARGALAAGDASATGDVIVLGHGRYSASDALAQAGRLGADGISVHTLCPPLPDAPLVAIEALAGPRRVRVGERVALEVTIGWNGVVAPGLAGGAARVEAVLRARSGEALARAPVDLPPGGGSVAVALDALAEALRDAARTGLLEAEVVLEGDLLARAGLPAAPAAWAALLDEEPARVLLVHGAAGAPAEGAGADPGGEPAAAARERLAAALKPVGEDVTLLAPSDLPRAAAALAGARAIVLAEVPADAVSPEQVRALEAHVRAGHSLVLAGARHAFGPGGYDNSAIDALSPVDSRPGAERRQPLWLVAVLDRSGSMAEEVAPGRSKLRVALDAVARAAQDLGEEDRLGLVAFAASPEVLLALGPADRAARLASIAPGGPTELFGAVERALRLLDEEPDEAREEGIDEARDDATKRPLRAVLLVSDGRSDATRDPARARAALLDALARAEPRARLSAVAIGADADVDLLDALTRAGGGRLVQAGAREADLADAIRREADPRVVDLLVDGPHRVDAADAAREVGLEPGARLPDAAQAARTRPREGTRVGVEIAGLGPALAWAERGAGRVVAVPLGDGAAQAAATALAVRASAAPALDLRAHVALRAVSASADRYQIVVDLGARAEAEGAVLRAQAANKPIVLVEEAPGRYASEELAWPARPEVLAIVQDARVLARTLVAPPTPEAPTLPADRALLTALAARSGGEVIDARGAPRPLPRLRSAGARDLPLRTPLALFAALLVVLDALLALRARRAAAARAA